MMQVKFGLNQIAKPTPQNISLGVKILTVVIGIIVMWVSHTALLKPVTKDEINFDLGLLATAIHLLAPLFGIQIDDNTNVPAKDIEVMQNK